MELIDQLFKMLDTPQSKMSDNINQQEEQKTALDDLRTIFKEYIQNNSNSVTPLQVVANLTYINDVLQESEQE